MPKRSKNSTDGAVFTYHERRNMDHGSTHIRLPGVALKAWDCCALGLTPPADPVITPDGVLYEREAVLRDLLRQREENRREEDHLAALLIDEEVRREARRTASNLAAIEQFERSQESSTPASARDQQPPTENNGITRRDGNSVQSNFWLPSVQNKAQEVPKAKQSSKKRKRSFRTRCPISKKPLRARDLIPLNLVSNKKSRKGTTGDPSASTSASFICPVCQTSLVNAVKPIALRTGTVLCSQCVAKFVLKERIDPHTSRAINVEKDIIPIFNVGTAFAASAEDDPSSREASLYRPSAR